MDRGLCTHANMLAVLALSPWLLSPIEKPCLKLLQGFSLSQGCVLLSWPWTLLTSHQQLALMMSKVFSNLDNHTIHKDPDVWYNEIPGTCFSSGQMWSSGLPQQHLQFILERKFLLLLHLFFFWLLEDSKQLQRWVSATLMSFSRYEHNLYLGSLDGSRLQGKS